MDITAKTPREDKPVLYYCTYNKVSVRNIKIIVSSHILSEIIVHLCISHNTSILGPISGSFDSCAKYYDNELKDISP